MKKSTLLSLLTAGAIIMTSAGTYAAWDTLDVSKTVTLKTAESHTVSLPSEDLSFNGKLTGDNLSVQAPLDVVTSHAGSLKLESSAVKLNNTENSNIKVEFLDSTGKAITDPTNIAVTDGVEQKNSYIVKVSLPAEAENDVSYASQDISFDIKATITQNAD